MGVQFGRDGEALSGGEDVEGSAEGGDGGGGGGGIGGDAVEVDVTAGKLGWVVVEIGGSGYSHYSADGNGCFDEVERVDA